MRADPELNLPILGQTFATLGVRTPKDISVDANGNVLPKNGGMSVYRCAPHELPPAIRPEKFPGGQGRYTAFEIDEANLGPNLIPNDDEIDAEHHLNVEPVAPMPFDLFLASIHATRNFWSPR